MQHSNATCASECILLGVAGIGGRSTQTATDAPSLKKMSRSDDEAVNLTRARLLTIFKNFTCVVVVLRGGGTKGRAAG